MEKRTHTLALAGSARDSPPNDLPVSDQERQRLDQAVQNLFGYPGLRPGQAGTMAAVLRGENVLTILPTGGGKSLCYQLPALLDEGGITLVISPLIALMKDQVESLPPAARRQATTINSSLGRDELRRRMRQIAAGDYRLVYVAPERLRQPPFLHALLQAGVNRLVIDEAHCISTWGHDFRPDYLYIAQAHQALGSPPLLAMTASAPPHVRRDMLQRLSTPEIQAQGGIAVVATDVFRPNLYLAAVRAWDEDERLQHVMALCQAETGSGIIYAGTRKRCEELAALLRAQGISAGYYHAGISDQAERAAAQDAFMSGEVRVMVATIAFGMGIDKPDTRFTIHLELPASLEAYYQEAGRAGRDGLPARCVLIHSPSDRNNLLHKAEQNALPVEFLRKVYAAVKCCLRDAPLGRVGINNLEQAVGASGTPARVALSMLEKAGLLRRCQDTPRAAVARLLQDTATLSPDWAAFIAAAQLQPGRSRSLDLLAVARAANLDPMEVESKLLTWAGAGWLDYTFSGREMLLELLPPPDDAAERVAALIERHAVAQVRRVDEIAAYAATHRCRHAHLSAYLNDQVMQGCQSCDNCQPDVQVVAAPDSMDEREQFQVILRCVAMAPWSWGRTRLGHILRGEPFAPQRGRKSSEWAKLSFRSAKAINSMLDYMIDADFLYLRRLDQGGVVVELTQASDAALKDPTRLAPLLAKSPAAPDDPKHSSVGKSIWGRLRGRVSSKKRIVV